MPTCRIKWIDENGKLTPDENPAVGYAWIEAHDTVHPASYGSALRGTPLHVDESEHYPICAEHRRVWLENRVEMAEAHWCFEPISTPAVPEVA